MTGKDKRHYLKILLFILLIINYLILSLRWVWWLLDDQYGCGDRVRTSFANWKSDGHVAISQIYSQIYCDIYYFAGFTLVLLILFLAILHTYKNND